MKKAKQINVKVIRTKKQYNHYLKTIEELMDADPAKGSERGELLETLTILVEDFEKKQGWDIPMPDDPVRVIRMRMGDLGLNQADLAQVIGDKTVVSRILNGTRKLTYSMVIPLSKLLRIPPEFLLEKNAA
jgi:HTH-type transcriptional regulator/antitoxin HigA